MAESGVYYASSALKEVANSNLGLVGVQKNVNPCDALIRPVK